MCDPKIPDALVELIHGNVIQFEPDGKLSAWN
jgi:hypothetical protein